MACKPLSPALRKLILTAHIIFAVGWLGAVAAFLALAIVGLNSESVQEVRTAYMAMDLITRSVIVPLSFAPLVTGPVLSLGTPWGLFKHYWIIVKLLITLLSTAILQIHLQPITTLADKAAEGLIGADLGQLQMQMVAAAAAALVALIVATVLAVYKPRGETRFTV